MSDCPNCAWLSDEVQFWREQRHLAASVAATITDLSRAGDEPLFTERAAVACGWLDPVAAAQLRAERDALLPVVEAAKAWRERFAYDIADFKMLLLAGERDLVAAVDALLPTEGAQP